MIYDLEIRNTPLTVPAEAQQISFERGVDAVSHQPLPASLGIGACTGDLVYSGRIIGRVEELLAQPALLNRILYEVLPPIQDVALLTPYRLDVTWKRVLAYFGASRDGIDESLRLEALAVFHEMERLMRQFRLNRNALHQA